jgi:hypothetical protein
VTISGFFFFFFHESLEIYYKFWRFVHRWVHSGLPRSSFVCLVVKLEKFHCVDGWFCLLTKKKKKKTDSVIGLNSGLGFLRL